MAAAAQFLRKGLKVVLIDKNIIGGSSSGRSAGIPDTRTASSNCTSSAAATETRPRARSGTRPAGASSVIVAAIRKYDIQCGLLEQDSLFLGLGKGGYEAAKSELECRKDVGFTDQKLYDAEQLKSILGSEGYTAGIRYGGTYGINPLQCLQGFKDLLIDDGMQIYESTAMKRLEGHTVYTHAGSVTADHIIIAVDKLEPTISPLSAEVFHAQTFLSVTEPLTDRERSVLFPSGEQMQCWDSKLVYTYFRLTADNRLLLGGGSPFTTFLKDAYNNPGVIKRVIADFYEHFPQLKSLAFIQFWPGQIDTTRDLLPTIVRPKDQPHLRFIFGCVGIPWATFTGSFAARNVLGDADEDYAKYFNYFSNERYFWLPSSLGNVIGKPMLFSLSNSWAKFKQVDKLREGAADGQKEF